jgi:hypothetical protein
MDQDPKFDVSRFKYNNFSSKQKERILSENKKMNGGVVRSDLAGSEYFEWLTGQTPGPDSPEIDHIHPKSKGGIIAGVDASISCQRKRGES